MPAGAPNVRLAQRPEEVEALDARYVQAMVDADGRSASVRVQAFEDAVLTSKAVVAMSIDELRNLAQDSEQLYANYHQTVRAQVRRPAPLVFEQMRMAVDSKLWGSAGDQIRYAALSLDGDGLSSYGDCFVTLKEKPHIAHRASALEVNSFKFVERVGVLEPLPLGFRSDWDNTAKLATAKCASAIHPHTNDKEFPAILLKSTGDRHKDDYVEVHIYGSFNFKAFTAVSIFKIKKRSQREVVTLKVLKDIAIKEGLNWRE